MRSDARKRLAHDELTLIVEPPCDFISANGRLHYQARARLTRAWREAMCAEVERHFLPDRYDRAHITVHIRFPDNIRRDVGNYFPTAKALVDGLVDMQVIADDNDEIITGPDMRREYPNGPARVTVHIERQQQ